MFRYLTLIAQNGCKLDSVTNNLSTEYLPLVGNKYGTNTDDYQLEVELHSEKCSVTEIYYKDKIM